MKDGALAPSFVFHAKHTVFQFFMHKQRVKNKIKNKNHRFFFD